MQKSQSELSGPLAAGDPDTHRVRVFAVFVLVAGLVAVEAYAGASGNEAVGEVGVDLLFVPVAVSAHFFGLRGAALVAALATSILVVLYVLAEVITAEVLVTNPVLFVIVGGLVGLLVERDRATALLLAKQSRVMERRHHLSLELLATMEGGRFIDANPAWLRKLGYRPEDLVGHDFLAFVHPDDLAQVKESRRRLAEGAEIPVQACRFRHRDGHYLWLEWSARRDLDGDGTYIAGRDITVRREAEDTVLLHREMLERAVNERTAALQERTAEYEKTARDLEFARREDLRRLAMVAEFRDDQTAEHTERVGKSAALIARELGLPETDVKQIYEAAPLHDIGKIGTPDAILLKPRGLTDAEREVMHQHTLLGHRLLSGSRTPVLDLAAQIALSHHEWWDGTGYPNHLAGHDIPLEARIVALADVLDALTHDRPYKPAWTRTEAMKEITALSGRQFDPLVVDALRRLTNEHPHQPDQPPPHTTPIPPREQPTATPHPPPAMHRT